VKTAILGPFVLFACTPPVPVAAPAPPPASVPPSGGASVGGGHQATAPPRIRWGLNVIYPDTEHKEFVVPSDPAGPIPIPSGQPPWFCGYTFARLAGGDETLQIVCVYQSGDQAAAEMGVVCALGSGTGDTSTLSISDKSTPKGHPTSFVLSCFADKAP
jgi:hypothetical protein